MPVRVDERVLENAFFNNYAENKNSNEKHACERGSLTRSLMAYKVIVAHDGFSSIYNASYF